MQARKLFIFSGLGVDHRVFESIDFGIHHPVYIRWETPLKKESLSSYAERLSAQVSEKDALFIGLSFGGMMAIEVAKLVPPSKIILLASAKTWLEIPFYYRWAGIFGIHKLIPIKLLKRANNFTYWIFGVTREKDRHLLKAILEDTNPCFLKWAINKIIHWKNDTIPAPLIHLHGSKDRILPFRFVSADIKIDGGGHFMTVDKAQELSALLKALL